MSSEKDLMLQMNKENPSLGCAVPQGRDTVNTAMQVLNTLSSTDGSPQVQRPPCAAAPWAGHVMVARRSKLGGKESVGGQQVLERAWGEDQTWAWMAREVQRQGRHWQAAGAGWGSEAETQQRGIRSWRGSGHQLATDCAVRGLVPLSIFP